MALTRDSRITVRARAERDPKFRAALLTEAINACLAGDTHTGKAVLRELVNAMAGFEGVAAKVNMPGKSLHRMLSPHGNPSAKNFFRVVKALQMRIPARLRVTAELG